MQSIDRLPSHLNVGIKSLAYETPKATPGSVINFIQKLKKGGNHHVNGDQVLASYVIN